MDTPPSYRGFRFPPEVIAHAVWLHHQFPLSYRDVQELLFESGVQVSYQAIRLWCDRFGPGYAARLRHRRPRPGERRHLDEVFLKVNGRMRYLRRAVDQDPGPRGRARGHRDRQAPLLRRRPPRGHAAGRAPDLDVPEQPRRQLPSANEATRVRHAEVPQHRHGPAVPVLLLPYRTLPCTRSR